MGLFNSQSRRSSFIVAADNTITVTNFAALPAAASNSGMLAYVRNSQGIVFINRKISGWYYSDGVNWLKDEIATDEDTEIATDPTGRTNTTSATVEGALDELDAAISSVSSAPLPIAAGGGTADAITADFSPDVALTDKKVVLVVATAANATTTPTFAPDGLAAHTITKFGGQALVAGDIRAALHVLILEYNLANTRWELLNPVFTQTSVSGNAATVTTNANLTGAVTSVGNATTVVTNANLTGPVTSVGNATTIAAGVVTNSMHATPTTLNNAGSAGGTANAQTLTPTPALGAYAAGVMFNFIPVATNTSGTVTVNVSSLGTRNIKKFLGSTVVLLAVGDITINAPALMIDDGTQFILMNPRKDAQGADVASATTTVLDTVTGDYVNITGTTTITAITLAQGRQVTVQFSGALTFTNGASLILPGGANITTAAGDTCVLRGEASSVVRCLEYNKKSGLAVIAPDASTLTGNTLASGVVTSSLTTVGTIATGTWSATTIAVNKGGTGQTSYTDGQLLIGATTGNTLAKGTITAAGGLVVTNGTSTIALSVSALQTLWVPAAAIRPSSVLGCNALALVASASNQPDISTLDFDPSTQWFAQFSVRFPKGWNASTVTAAFVWSHPSTSTNFGVTWALQAVSIADNEAMAVAYGTEQIIADTGGTTDKQYISGATPAITIAGTPATGEVVYFRVKRNPADASDTMAVNARLHGVLVFYTITSLDDT